jgi:hypothetical protein
MNIMKWPRYVSVSAAAVLVALLAPCVASAATSTYHLQGNNAAAGFEAMDQDGCTFTGAYVNVYETRDNIPPGGPQSGTWLSVQIYKTNECLGYEILLNAFGSVALPAGAFDVQGNLTGATLDAEVPVFDYVTGQSGVVAISLSWTGEGDIFRNMQNTRYSSPSYKFTYRSNGSYRSADVTGSLVYGGVDLTTGASAAGYLTASQSGSVTIEKY